MLRVASVGFGDGTPPPSTGNHIRSSDIGVRVTTYGEQLSDQSTLEPRSGGDSVSTTHAGKPLFQLKPVTITVQSAPSLVKRYSHHVEVDKVMPEHKPKVLLGDTGVNPNVHERSQTLKRVHQTWKWEEGWKFP